MAGQVPGQVRLIIPFFCLLLLTCKQYHLYQGGRWGLLSRGERNPSKGVNLTQIRVEGLVSVVTHPSIGVNRTQILKARV